MRYRERSRFSRWIWILVGPAVIVAWYGFIQQIVFGVPFGSKPAPDLAVWLVWIGVGFFLPLFMWKAGLVVEVREGALHYRWRPFIRRRLEGADIASAEPRTYRPLLDYGGWGVRYGGPERGWAYTTRGRTGVFITCRDGKCLLIGSDDPEGLAEAISGIIAAA